MSNRISLIAVGHATSLLLAITFALCVAFDVLFPEHAMYTVWQKLLPGFTGINLSSFFIGLIEAYGYGWYAALIWVPIYNWSANRSSHRCKHCEHGNATK